MAPSWLLRGTPGRTGPFAENPSTFLEITPAVPVWPSLGYLILRPLSPGREITWSPQLREPRGVATASVPLTPATAATSPAIAAAMEPPESVGLVLEPGAFPPDYGKARPPSPLLFVCFFGTRRGWSPGLIGTATRRVGRRGRLEGCCGVGLEVRFGC